MIQFHRLETDAELESVRALAMRIFRRTYHELLSSEQIDYMLEWMYSVAVMKRELAEGTSYYRIETSDGVPVGYLAFTPDHGHENSLKLDKLYLDFSLHSRGLGSQSLDFVKAQARARGFSAVYLNVNKNNPRAIAAYQRNGFVMDHAETNAIGNGYEMDDYVMVCRLY